MAPLIRHAEVPVNFQHVPLGAPSPPGSLTLIRRGLTRAAFNAAGSVLSKLRSAWSSTPKSVPQFPEKPPEKFYEAPSWWSSFIFGSSDKLQTNREMIYGTAYRDRPVSNYGDLEAMSFELNKGRLGELRALKAQKVKEEKKLDKKPKQTNSDIIKLDQIKADVKGLEEEMKKLLRSAEEHVARLNRPEHINAWDDSKKPDFQRGLEDSLVVGPEIESGYNGESSVTQMPGAWIYSPTTDGGLPYSWKLDTNSEHPSTTGGNAFERKVRLGDDLMTSGLLSDNPKVRFEEPLPTPNERTRAVKEKKGKDARKGKGGGRALVDWEKTWEEESDGDKSKKGGKGKKENKKGDKDKKSGKIITDQVLDSWTQEVYVSPHAVSAYNPEPDLSYTGEKLTPLLGWHLPNDSTGATGPSIFNTKLSTAFGAFGLPDYDGISEMNTDSTIADMSNRVTGKETPKKIDKGKGREFEPLPDSLETSLDGLTIFPPQAISYGTSSEDGIPVKQRKTYPKTRWPTAAEIPDDPDELLNPDGIPRLDPTVPIKMGKDWKEATRLQVDTNTGGFHIDSKSPVLPEVDTKQVLSEAANDRERADERKTDQESGGIVGEDSPVTSYWGSTFKPQNGGSSGTVTDITLDTPHTPPVASTNGKARPASKPRLAIKPGNSLNQKYEENIELESLGEETNPRAADASSSGSSTSIPQVFVTPPKDVSPSASLMPVPAAVGRNIWNRLFGGTVTPLVVAGPSAISPAFSVPAEVPDSLLPETLVGLPTLDLIPEDDFWINAWENPNPSDYVPVSGYDRKGKGKGKAKTPLAKRDDYGHMHSEISPMRMQQRLLGRAEIGHRFETAITCTLSICGVFFVVIIIVAIVKAWTDRDGILRSRPRRRRRRDGITMV